MSVLEQLGGVLLDVAERARHATVEVTREKAPQDFVSNVDHQLDAALTAALTKLTPELSVLSEERQYDATQVAERYWIIDPLDGTHNFLAGVAFCAVSAALVGPTGTELGGVVNIFSGDLYLAERDKGATRNGGRLSATTRPSGLLATSSGTLDVLVKHPDLFGRLRGLGKLRNFGSQALHLCMVASGELSAALSAEARFWDDAAGSLVAREAGARYATFTAGPTNDARTALRSLCAHPAHHATLVPIARSLFTTPHGVGES